MEIRKLEIRRLKEEELGHALKLVWEVFERDIKPIYTEEGVQEFLKFIDYHFIKEAYDNGEMIFWGAFEEELIGTVAVRPDGHISLFFVKNEYQRLGVGKALFQMMYNYCVEELKVKKITVNSAPQAVVKYIHMGMRQVGNMEEKHGIRSVPMEMYASPTLVRPVEFRKKKSNKSMKKDIWIGIAILAGIIIFIGGMIFLGVRLFKKNVSFNVDKNIIQEMPYDGGFGGGQNDGSGIPGEAPANDEALSGVDAIPAYEAKNLPYEIINDAYNFVDKDKINTIIEFGVQYPQIQSDELDSAVLEKVNQALEDCAMETVEEIYNNPSDEIKEAVLHAEMPVLVSYVTYKVTYANDKFISVVMEDQGYHGSQEAYKYDFRTINVSLETGEIYQVKDIVNVDNDFIKEWLMTMRTEADNSELLSELNEKELKKALEGESHEGVYEVEYFFDEEGLEIGFAFDYEKDDKNDQGYAWVTAPFSFEEIEKFSSDSAIWSEIN